MNDALERFDKWRHADHLREITEIYRFGRDDDFVLVSTAHYFGRFELVISLRELR